MSYTINREFAEVWILKKVKLDLFFLIMWIIWQILEYIMILTRGSPGNSQMTFIFGGGFAEVQVLIKVENALSLELFGIFG